MKIYFDNVSTTSLNPEVEAAYEKLLKTSYANSDALYDDGVAIYDMQEKSRKLIAEYMGVLKDEVIFTSGASEANSMAIKGYCFKHQDKKHIITSIYEHSSVYHAVKDLEEYFGYEVTYLQPNSDGIIEASDVEKALRNDTALVSIMWVNNEIGSINPIDEIGKIVKKHSGTVFHSDITQALGKCEVSLENVDMASFSAHKIHGLKGSGALIKKKFVELLPLINGGQQEYGIRGGTSNALVNVVLAKTLRLSLEKMTKEKECLKKLHDYLENELRKIDSIRINSPRGSLDTLFNISTPVQSEVALNALNLKGIMVSSKSTCGSKTNEPNRALYAMGVDDNYALRVSFDSSNTKEEIDYFITCIKEIIDKYARTTV